MSQVAMFSKTGGNDFPSYLKCMVSGPPKSGKTTLLGTVPNILVLDTEPHANNLQSVAHLDLPFKAIHSTDDLRQAQFILSQEQFRKQAAQALGLPDIEAVAIDTLDTLQAIMKKERMREQRSSKFLRDDWGWLKEEMVSILDSFLSLPMHVFFVVHTKSENVGTEENPRTVILPGLEGSIARQIAGMVGYSLLSFRKEEIKPDGSGKYTKYWLRTEGDETYEYLGNRAAGRLPDIIEPHFNTLLSAAMANRPTNQGGQVQVDLSGLQTTGQIQPPIQPQQQAPAQPLAQVPGQQVPQQQTQQQQVPTGQPQNMPADDEPMNAAALGHVKKVYDALGLALPEDKVMALNLGQARDIVRTFKAIQTDASEGKDPNPAETMRQYLDMNGLLPVEGQQAERAKPVEPKIDGNIDEVKAWVGDGSDLARVNQAYEVERTGKNRKSLMEWLESKGASHGAAAQPNGGIDAPSVAPVANPPGQVQTSVQTPEQSAPAPDPAPQAPAPAGTGVTPEAPAADAPVTEEQAVANVQEALGGEVISQEINADAKCEECGNQIDDVDLAQLGKSRFGRVFCVADYIAETKKPRGN